MSKQARSAEKMGYIRFELQVAATGKCLKKFKNLDSAIKRAEADLEESEYAGEYEENYAEVHAIYTDVKGEQNSVKVWTEYSGEYAYDNNYKLIGVVE